jgi:hypothetical protein
MKELITIVCDPIDDNMPLANMLAAQINQAGVYDSAIKKPDEYAEASVEEELLGKVSEKIAIFIGTTKAIDTISQISNRNNKTHLYQKFGIRYGWYGKQAYLYVQKEKFSESEIKEFSEALGIEEKPETGVKGTLNKISSKIDKLPLGLKIAGVVGGAVLLSVGAAVVAGSAFLINGKINQGKLFENQLAYAGKIFYEQGLPQFMGNL